MAKVYAIHEIEVYPGKDEKELKKAFKDLAGVVNREWGWKMTLLRGDRGLRGGKYAVMYEIKSVEERDRFAPSHHQPSAEANRLFVEQRAMIDPIMKRWAEFSPTDIGAHMEYTDYVAVA